MSDTDRTLDSFPDHIITRQAPRENGKWSAILDCGIIENVSDPDFAPYGYGDSAAEASRKCALAIRKNASGNFKSPYSVLRAGSYDLHYRLMAHWKKKERFEALGIDPNEVILLARNIEFDMWSLGGDWLSKWNNTRAMEFEYQFHSANAVHDVMNGILDVPTAKANVMSEMRNWFAFTFSGHAKESTWKTLEERIDMKLAEVAKPNPEMSGTPVSVWSVYGSIQIHGETRTIWQSEIDDVGTIYQITKGQEPGNNSGGYRLLETLLEFKGVEMKDVEVISSFPSPM